MNIDCVRFTPAKTQPGHAHTMTTTMSRSVMLTVLMHNILLVSHGVWCSEPEDGASLQAGALVLPWQDELCCDSRTAPFNEAGGDTDAPETNRSESKLPHSPRCRFRSLTTGTRPRELSGHKSSFNNGTCLDILCRIDENWEKLTCDLTSGGRTSTALDAGLMAVSLRRVLSQKEDSLVNSGNTSPDKPVACEAKDSFVCSIALDTTTSFIAVVTVSVSDAEALPVQLRIPARPVKPSPPVNLSHIQTTEAELILLWDGPTDFDTGPLRYEVRYSFNTTRPAWQVMSAPAGPRLPLDLKPRLNYTIQVRCSGPGEPPLWSDWSESHHIYLDTVSYIPEKVVARPGENVTVYCVFNDRGINASAAVWVLNFQQPLPRSQYHPVNQRVSQITVRPSETRMYDLLQCIQEWTLPYSQIYVEVKPHTPTNVKAVSRSSGVLAVTWEPPSLPVDGLQCQFQYHSPSMVRAQPEWKVQSPVRVPRAEVVVPDMCRVYVVRVRCMHTNGTGYWSEWSDSVYSAPQNSRAPERGPDFWRVLQGDPDRNQTNVTLLFEDLPVSGHSSHCVDGFIVQHQTSGGAVTREWIEPASSYSFEWNQELQTVTVEAYNSLGSSANNINMTLERQPKRHCVRSFRVLLTNSTCVSLSWSLLDNSSAPLSMVVQWSPHRQPESGRPRAQGGETWARLPYVDHPVYLRGDFFSSEDYGFYLHPVFAEGEGEPVFTIATRADPAAYMMLMIISFLAIVLFVTLLLSQNQMKRFMWKDVPNPNKCSWAKGLDFKKADTFDHLFGPPEGLPAWALLLPSEDLSKVVIVDKADLCAATTALVQTPLVPPATDPAAASAISLPPGFDSEVDHSELTESELLLGGAPPLAVNADALTGSYPRIDEFQPVVSQAAQPPGSADNSAQSSVTYATVLLSDPKQEQPPVHLHYKGSSGSSSSDEGNFSANNSDISGSFPGGLWELDSCRGGETDDPRRSCSYNSVEELYETSEQEDDGEARDEKDLYYLGMDYPAEDEASEDEDERREEAAKIDLRKNVVLTRDDCSVESRPLLCPGDSSSRTGPLSASTRGFTPLYLPQFRTAPCTRQLQDSEPEL
ncbi:hypothetical protein F2P81_005437 [Scophthalmus maximus]|uniref:Fibronectin type-III domain-containing protein n=1 Tax=Scophthalmus maximus TaxID=52904 RepID=A0A6A4T9M3_SCOMX|nr:hypothetical protein F2P81_005437 [Scophthalmus maximus]